MKNTLLIYWKWTWAFHRHYELCVVLQTIPTLTLKQRKDLLGLARSQTPVVQGSYVASQLPSLYQTIAIPSDINQSYANIRYVSMPFGSFLRTYQDAYLLPACSSIIALATRISPSTTQEEYEEVLSGSVSKELSAAITRTMHAQINFECIFSSDLWCRDIPFTDRMTSNPEVASDTYQILCRLRQSLSNQTFFPSIGKKTVGSIVATNFWKSYHAHGCVFKHETDRFGDVDQVTTRDCMRLYLETGGYVDGPVEVRSSWKYTQISPRVYYARGGDVIPGSQYMQPIVNQIIDAFPEVHRLNRFSPPDDPMDPTDVEVIYDYSSFTSSLDSVVEFIRNLAIFFSGTSVNLIDVRDGIESVDLGDLFDKYNKVCNEYSSFDPTKVLAHWKADSVILEHTCGMLGVEGNIFIDTILHGIHLRFLAGLNRSRCVGDDARFHKSTRAGRLSDDDREVMKWSLSGIGEINDKFGVFEAEVDPVLQAYRYVKRPLHRDVDFMVEGFMFDVPSLIPLFKLDDRFHTVLPSSTHPCRATFKSIIRLLSVMKHHSYTLEEYDKEVGILADHVQYLVREIRVQDPDGTHSPFARSNLNTHYVLPPVTFWGRWSYEEWMLHELGYHDEVRFLKRGGADTEGECDGRVGSVMIRETSKGRSFLEKLGYLSREDLFDVVSIAEFGHATMMEYLRGDYLSVCKFTVIEDIPPWYIHVPRVL